MYSPPNFSLQNIKPLFTGTDMTKAKCQVRLSSGPPRTSSQTSQSTSRSAKSLLATQASLRYVRFPKIQHCPYSCCFSPEKLPLPQMKVTILLGDPPCRLGSQERRLRGLATHCQKYVIRDSYLIIFLEPIEQNVHGNKGVYELVYFMKESKSLPRFRKQAEQFHALIEGKSDEEIERLVRISFSPSLPNDACLVLEDPQAQCPCLWSRRRRVNI